jgi:hypothetical protein
MVQVIDLYVRVCLEHANASHSGRIFRVCQGKNLCLPKKVPARLGIHQIKGDGSREGTWTPASKGLASTVALGQQFYILSIDR